MIFFHTPWLKEETAQVLKTPDVLILPTRGNQSAASVPSKLISYLFAAKPVIALANEDSDVADVIRKANCGWVMSASSGLAAA